MNLQIAIITQKLSKKLTQASLLQPCLALYCLLPTSRLIKLNTNPISVIRIVVV
jgi:hypothetical protein